MSSVIEVNNLSFGYMQENILHNLSFKINQETFVGLAGPNGSGKTTLLNLLCALLKPKSGSITVNEADIKSYSIRELAKKIAVVRQEFVPVFDFTADQIVSMARTPYLGTFGFENKTDRQLIDEALEATDTAQFAHRAIGSLSGGERQRVFIARALAQDTPILLLDEPTNFLDLKHQVGIYDLLKTAQLEKGKTIVSVTHDINLTSQYCDEILLLATDTKYIYGNPEKVLSAEQIQEVFGIKVYESTIAQKKFFIPLGKYVNKSK
jgi:iron complex transport system ATP-binding protein